MEVIKEILSNGLTVILAPMEGTKTITEFYIVKAGWKDEQPENSGISHFIEHLIFKGTKKRPSAQDIIKEVEGKGGEINAETTDEYTYYWIKLPSRFIGTAHDLLSNMLLISEFDSHEVEKEKGIILEELHMTQDDPQMSVSDILWPSLLYKNQPAGQCGLGTEETIKSFKREQILDYIKKLYTAPNSAVCVAGRIENSREVLNELNRYFQEISQDKPGIKRLPVVENQKKSKILFQKRKIEQTQVMLGVRGYNVFHPDRYALQVLGVILGGSMSSRMFTEVREKKGLAYRIGTGVDFQSDAGWLATYAGLNSEKIIEALQAMINQYKKLAEERVPAEELQFTKSFILGSQEMAMEDSRKVAFDLAEQFILTGEVKTPEQKTEKFEAVSSEDIQRVAQDIFQNKNLNLAIVSPHRPDLKEKLYSILKF